VWCGRAYPSFAFFFFFFFFLTINRFTENVIEFLVEQIKKLPQDTQKVAQTAACLGSKFNSAAILEILHEDTVSSNLPLLISNGIK
jgi:predicted ATPase